MDGVGTLSMYPCSACTHAQHVPVQCCGARPLVISEVIFNQSLPSSSSIMKLMGTFQLLFVVLEVRKCCAPSWTSKSAIARKTTDTTGNFNFFCTQILKDSLVQLKHAASPGFQKIVVVLFRMNSLTTT